MLSPKLSLWAILFCCFHFIRTAPTIDELLSESESSIFPEATSCFSCHRAIPYMMDDVDSLLLGPWSPPEPTVSSSTISDQEQYPFSFSYMTTVSDSIPDSTLTVTITKEEPTTVTISLSPITITHVITVTALIAVSTPPPTMPSTPDTPAEGTKTAWSSPPDMTDLSSFQVSKFAGGEKNMKIITDTSAESDTDSDLSASSQKSAIPESQGSVMQLLYPANSIDPANKPQGGAEFYASPIDISEARNVTLGYSVFFPENFNWVLGGKLPGLYGGHAGCSGGNAALDCFSTRLMWRQDGAGELYLYAPKDKQTDDLCSDPTSVCDATYGLSVGRGLFKWQAGSWTTIQQTVYLNTPGKQDGQFTLHVNGEKAMHRDDVFYRDDINAKKASSSKPTKSVRPKKTSTRHEQPTTSVGNGDDGGGLLGPILGGILGIRGRSKGLSAETGASAEMEGKVIDRPQWRAAAIPEPTATREIAPATPTAMVEISSVAEAEVKFVGIFFSTFFGGHDPKWATPQDQYTWFKDFWLIYNE